MQPIHRRSNSTTERDRPAWGGAFTRFEDVDRNSFALVSFDEVSRAVEAQRRAAAEKQKVEQRAAHELEIAMQVQARLFPQRLPPMRTLEYAGACVQTRRVGGDADTFVDHTTQPGTTPDKAGVRKLYTYLREAFPDFHADIHWQLADGDRVTTYKTYRGTHEGTYLEIGPTHRSIHFETVDVMRVQNGKITDHWGVANLLSLMQQIGGWTPPSSAAIER